MSREGLFVECCCHIRVTVYNYRVCDVIEFFVTDYIVEFMKNVL